MADDQITTKPMQSQAQWRYLFASGKPFARRWAKETPGGVGRRFRRLPIKKKAYSVAEFAAVALKDDSVATAIAALHTPGLATLKGEQLAPGVTRIHGDLCNVHGRWGSCRAAGYGGAAPASKRVAPKKLPAAPKPKGGKRATGKKGGTARKPIKTDAQREQERQAKREQARQQHEADREQNRKDAVTKLRNQPNAASMEALAKLERGESIDPDMAQTLAGETGLVELHKDGTATLSSTGRAFLHALDRGDVAAAEDAQAQAQDRLVRDEDRAAAQAERKRATGERRAAAEARHAEAERRRQARLAKQKKGGGGRAKKQPEPRPVRTPLPRSSTPPRLVRGVGGGVRTPRQSKPEKPKAPVLPQNLIDAAQQLSAGSELDDAAIALLIRNGLARYDKNGVLVLTSAGQRATKKEAQYRPTRLLTAGHTGVMVALHPDKQATQAIVAVPGVTEPIEQLHLTLCYLGDSAKQPLVENKGRLIDAVQQWAIAQHPLQGAINGTGRFFHAESDGTNAVYVCPDVPGLPELRQSVVGVIEAAGLDYAQNHGFTPHITVAYVPLDAPTPPIRVEVPVAFDHVTLAWGDEQYEFPLGYPDQSQFAGYTMEDRDDASPDSFYHTTKAPSPNDYLVVEDRSKPSTWHLQVKRNGKPDHRLMGAAAAALGPQGYRGNRYEGPDKGKALAALKRLYAGEGMDFPALKDASFSVFKDASGAWRWVARTTTAFEDRDEEVISTESLKADCDRADHDGRYGPLRWWHMGRPDPLNTTAPWGAGIDLGWCDFNAVSGRTLIESGTFKTEAIARAVATHAPSLELSPGFFHAIGEPDASGVFHHIRRFERSLVPKWAGRASNPYTGIVVEKAMDQRKIDALQTLGVPETTIKALLAEVERTEKAADAGGVRYKDGGGIRDFFSALLRGEQVTVKEGAKEASGTPDAETGAGVSRDILSTLKAQIDALSAEVTALKAGPGMNMTGADEETPPEDMAEDGMEEPGEDTAGLTLSPEDLTAIGQVVGTAVTDALAPLVEALGIVQKFKGHMGELKSLMGNYVKQKEAGDQQKADQVAALKAQIDQTQTALADSQAKLADLLGDQPRNAGYRPTETTDNTAAGMLAAALKGGPPDGHVQSGPFDDLVANLFPGLVPSQ